MSSLSSQERITRVFNGVTPDRVPVSLYKISPFDATSFWAQHPSCKPLLDAAQTLQDTFCFYRPKTGFFFSAPDAIALKVEEVKDTAISKTVKLTVETELGPLTRTARSTRVSSVEWVEKPWIERTSDIKKFLSLPFMPYEPDLSDFFQTRTALGDKGVMAISLPDPVGIIGMLFAPGDLAKFALDYPVLVHQLLEKVHERLEPTYSSFSLRVENAVIRIRGAEYVTPPALPREYFPDIRRVFGDFVSRYDRGLIDILRKGRRNFICYHWHEFMEELAPMVLKLEPDIIEPMCNSSDMPDVVLRARKAFGDRVVIMGGLVAENLEFGDVEGIGRMVKEVLTQGARKGRFILIPSNVPTSVPLSPSVCQNYTEFLRAGTTYGVYPIK